MARNPETQRKNKISKYGGKNQKKLQKTLRKKETNQKKKNLEITE